MACAKQKNSRLLFWLCQFVKEMTDYVKTGQNRCCWHIANLLNKGLRCILEAHWENSSFYFIRVIASNVTQSSVILLCVCQVFSGNFSRERLPHCLIHFAISVCTMEHFCVCTMEHFWLL